MARPSGADVMMAKSFQSATYRAIQGKAHEAMVKKIAMLMLATKVLHFGPTYSRTARIKNVEINRRPN